MKTIIIKKYLDPYERFEVEPVPAVGACIVGRGSTMKEALGDYLINMQTEWKIFIDVDSSAWEDELKRRREELAKR